MKAVIPVPWVKSGRFVVPTNEPLNEPVNTEFAPVEMIELDPILRLPPLKVIPLFWRAPPIPAITKFPLVKTEDVIWAKCAFEPLTIIFFQVAIVYYKSIV